MTGSTPTLAQPYRPAGDQDDFHVSEVASDLVGAFAPWGDVEFPLPYQELAYAHPTKADRPRLAGA